MAKKVIEKRVGPMTKAFLAKQFILPYYYDEVIFGSEWSIEEIIALHSLLLELSLEELAAAAKSKESQNTKIEILEWIFADDIKLVHHKFARTEVIYLANKPFSFSLCCRFENIEPDDLRDKIFKKLKKVDQEKLQLALAA